MFRRLLSLEEAREAIQSQVRTGALGVEEIPLLEAADRVLAEDIVAMLDIPPFDRSTVD
jgi:molybdopterin biosynthesis enzyme